MDARLASLAARYDLSPTATTKLRLLLEQLLADPHAPTSIRDPLQAIDRHLADSLAALELEPVRAARLALDLGSGAGLPGMPLAAARPEAEFVLLESAARKCAFLHRAAQAAGIGNVEIVHGRAETFHFGFGRFDLVTARAVASLDVTAEYAAPLLQAGGALVVWTGRRSSDGEAAARYAAEQLGLGGLEARRVEPFPEARNRHLYLMSKVAETPSRFPRRPGRALKRPLGTHRTAVRWSDRGRR